MVVIWTSGQKGFLRGSPFTVLPSNLRDVYNEVEARTGNALDVQYSALGRQVWVSRASIDLGRAFSGLYGPRAGINTYTEMWVGGWEPVVGWLWLWAQ